jgi:hypothetical protein
MSCKILQFPKPVATEPRDHQWRLVREVLADILKDSHPEYAAAMKEMNK